MLSRQWLQRPRGRAEGGKGAAGSLTAASTAASCRSSWQCQHQAQMAPCRWPFVSIELLDGARCDTHAFHNYIHSEPDKNCERKMPDDDLCGNFQPWWACSAQQLLQLPPLPHSLGGMHAPFPCAPHPWGRAKNALPPAPSAVHPLPVSGWGPASQPALMTHVDQCGGVLGPDGQVALALWRC